MANDKASQNYADSLRNELLYLIERELTPLALKYHYSEEPLESKIKWQPVVLVLGNYSSGKSTFINELLGSNIQETGQAPTDDGFTVLTAGEPDALEVVQKDGHSVLQDPQYPFATLQKYGQSLASHFRLKKIPRSQLRGLAIIDTPGMLDSFTEKDRGYDYQQVIGELAQMSDLILVLFDAHKAGTVRESHASLRDTLPKKTYEDRMVFVLNRIDECGSLEDLLKVYGTLCWNLSQMMGRKDIPRILLTYAQKKADLLDLNAHSDRSYLSMLENQRQLLKKLVKQAPRQRLDHLVTFLEFHSYRISVLLEALQNYQTKRLGFIWLNSFFMFTMSSLLGAACGIILESQTWISQTGFGMVKVSCFFATTFFMISQFLIHTVFVKFFHARVLDRVDDLFDVDTQKRKDAWLSVIEPLRKCLLQKNQRIVTGSIKREREAITKIYQQGAKEFRKSINELHLDWDES
jgi:GTPase SAR1 family protein